MSSVGRSIEAGKGHVTLSADDSPLRKTLASAAAKFASFGQQVARLSMSMATAGVAAIGAAAKSFATWGDAIYQASRQTGAGFAEIINLMAGTRTSAEGLVGAITHVDGMLNKIAMGSMGSARALSVLGLRFSDLVGLGDAERIERIADALNALPSASQRAALQRQVLGGLELNIEGGAAGMRARAARDRESGGMATGADVTASRALSESFRDLSVAAAGLWRTIGTVAAPIITAMLQGLRDLSIQVRRFVEDSGLLTAVMLGDWKSVWNQVEAHGKIFFLDIEIAWRHSVDVVKNLLVDLKNTFMTAFADIGLSIYQAMNRAFTGIRVMWEVVKSAIDPRNQFRDAADVAKELTATTLRIGREANARDANAQATRDAAVAGLGGATTDPGIAAAMGQQNNLRSYLNSLEMEAWFNARINEVNNQMDTAGQGPRGDFINANSSVAGSFSGAAISGFISAAGSGETRQERTSRESRDFLERITRRMDGMRGAVMV